MMLSCVVVCWEHIRKQPCLWGCITSIVMSSFFVRVQNDLKKQVWLCPRGKRQRNSHNWKAVEGAAAAACYQMSSGCSARRCVFLHISDAAQQQHRFSCSVWRPAFIHNSMASASFLFRTFQESFKTQIYTWHKQSGTNSCGFCWWWEFWAVLLLLSYINSFFSSDLK